MNQFLCTALNSHYDRMKKSKTRRNYRQCYNAFLEYCEIYGDCDLKDLFNNKIVRQDIIGACELYYITSTRATKKEAIHRFLSAIDLFYRDYIKKMGGITCDVLEGGCRNKDMINDIQSHLKKQLVKETYIPADDETELKVKQICSQINDESFYRFGQKIICSLLLEYGFKLDQIVDLKYADVNCDEGIIIVRNRNGILNLSITKELIGDIRHYNQIQKYKDREFFFTNTKGRKIDSYSAISTVSGWVKKDGYNISNTTLALKGISKLIQKGLTISEIKCLTGFETKKIEDASNYLMAQYDKETVINEKLKKTRAS